MEIHWKPNKYDLVISTSLAVIFPFLASLIYTATGALIPMILYYGLAWGISYWRRGYSGYTKSSKVKIPKAFIINLVVITACVILAFFARNTEIIPNTTGAILTGLIWAPLNAASEQLLWIYLYDSWDLIQPMQERFSSNKWHWMRRIVGIILFTFFIGTIHTLFWVKFLHTVDSNSIVGIIFVILTAISGYLHIIAWRESGNMFFTFIPHLLLNLVPLFWTGYSILPFLLKWI